MEHQPTSPPAASLPPIVRHTLAYIAAGSLAAWIAQALGCYHRLWGYCDFSHALTLAALVALFVLAPLAYSFRERALRKSRRGMWARSSWGTGHELTATFSRVVKLAIQGEEEAGPAGLITGTRRFERRGWWITVPIAGGRPVWVDRWQLWQWLIEVEGLRYQLEPGESPISQRYWEPKIGRGRWMAYMVILESVGVAETATGDPRSRRYMGGGDAWGVVEEFEKVRESGER